MRTRWVVVIVAFAILLAAAWGYGQARVNDARAEAERAREEKVMAGLRADSLDALVTHHKAAAQRAQQELEAERDRAAAAAEASRILADAAALSAVQTGQVLREAIVDVLGAGSASAPVAADSLLAFLDRHLDEDQAAMNAARTAWEEEHLARLATDHPWGPSR